MLLLGLIIGGVLGWAGGYWIRDRVAISDARQRERVNPQTPYVNNKTGELYRWRDRAWAHDSNAEFAIMTRISDFRPLVFPDPVFIAEFKMLSDADLLARHEARG